MYHHSNCLNLQTRLKFKDTLNKCLLKTKNKNLLHLKNGITFKSDNVVCFETVTKTADKDCQFKHTHLHMKVIKTIVVL